MLTFPFTVPQAKIGLFFAQTRQEIVSFSPTSIICFLIIFESHNTTWGAWQTIARISPSVSHANAVHKLKSENIYTYYKHFWISLSIFHCVSRKRFFQIFNFHSTVLIFSLFWLTLHKFVLFLFFVYFYLGFNLCSILQ